MISIIMQTLTQESLSKRRKGKSSTLRSINLNYLIELEITKLSEELQKQSTIEYTQDYKVNEKYDLFKLIFYILKKQTKYPSDLTVMRYFLSQYSTLISILKLKKETIDDNQMFNKLTLFLQVEPFPPERVICKNGSVGDKFYLILKGSVAVLVPIPYKKELTVLEYFNHLLMLKRHKEYSLIKQSNDSNHYSFIGLDVMDELSEEKLIKEAENERNEGNECISVEEYINRLMQTPNELKGDALDNEYRAIEQKKIVHTFTLWTYQKICELKTGDSFGDIALKEENSLRTATIISSSETFLGSLTREAYNICLKDAQERVRKAKVNKVFSNKLFDDFYPLAFERYYFNYFRFVEFNRGERIFSQGSTRDSIYFLLEGEIQLIAKTSLSNIKAVIHSLGGKDDDKLSLTQAEVISSELVKYYQRVKEFKIYGMKNKEMIGLEDCLVEKKYFCSAYCISNRCEVYSIDEELFKKMIANETVLRNNYRRIQSKRIVSMINRLLSIKDITLLSYCNSKRVDSCLLQDVSGMNYSLPKISDQSKDNRDLLNAKNTSYFTSESTTKTIRKIAKEKGIFSLKINQNNVVLDHNKQLSVDVSGSNFNDNTPFHYDKGKKLLYKRYFIKEFNKENNGSLSNEYLNSSEGLSNIPHHKHNKQSEERLSHNEKSLFSDNEIKKHYPSVYGSKQNKNKILTYNYLINKLVDSFPKFALVQSDHHSVLSFQGNLTVKTIDPLAFDKFVEKTEKPRSKKKYKANPLKVIHLIKIKKKCKHNV